eukprot:CAMPEP_0177681880 /NCGR_PEP_ID=MMETSP0447-20121125/30961_1 /TAXON_ID=0 /ORGANISM="Stygamoeba regulata, Strain BSH-02190019" /LENGTH=278 /DNA_ID=CAMNT_0019191345 /DNA_START=179 /DNA_END=1016 /DNA_ORIENTATION=-
MNIPQQKFAPGGGSPIRLGPSPTFFPSTSPTTKKTDQLFAPGGSLSAGTSPKGGFHGGSVSAGNTSPIGIGGQHTPPQHPVNSPTSKEYFAKAQPVVITAGAHQLQNSWSFWYDRFVPTGVSVTEFESSLRHLCVFTSAEGFWQCFNNLPTLAELRHKSSFFMMKEGIRPVWEDPGNADGGIWSIRIGRSDNEMVWKELLVAAIGEQFADVLDEDDDICGISVNVRNYNNIFQIWNKNSKANTKRLLEKVEALLPNVNLISPFYKANRDHSAFNTQPA